MNDAKSAGWIALLVLGACLMPWPAGAERADRNQPTLIVADHQTVDDLKQLSVFTGHVVLTKGTIRVTGERMEYREDPEGYQYAVVTAAADSLATFHQRRDPNRPGVEETIDGVAERIEYDNRADTVKLFTRAIVRRFENGVMRDEFTGDRITYVALHVAAQLAVNVGDIVMVQTPQGTLSPMGMMIVPRRLRVAGIFYLGFYEYDSTYGFLSLPVAEAPDAIDASADAGALPRGLVVERLAKRYGGRLVVKDVSLSVEPGAVVGLLGPNGAGKTTCFYMVVGLVPLDDGSIRLDGRSIAHLPIHRRARLGLSYLPQEASVFRRLTVEQNVRAVLELQRDDQGRQLREEAIEQRLVELLKDLQIVEIRTNAALSLSGGERRRVEIARALAARPRYVLLDEPFAGVDPIAVIEIQRIVRFLKQRGIGVLITDHNVRETLGICDHAYIINEGQVLAEGRPDEIVENESVRRVYLGEHFRM